MIPHGWRLLSTIALLLVILSNYQRRYQILCILMYLVIYDKTSFMRASHSSRVLYEMISVPFKVLNVSIVRYGLLLNKYMIQHYVVTHISHVAWASYEISKLVGCAWAGNAGNVFPHRQHQRKPLVSDPGMHRCTCLTHVPWCISGSLTRGNGENVLGIPSACAPVILRIWQEAHTSTCIFHTPSHGTCFTTAFQTSHQKGFCRLTKMRLHLKTLHTSTVGATQTCV